MNRLFRTPITLLFAASLILSGCARLRPSPTASPTMGAPVTTAAIETTPTEQPTASPVAAATITAQPVDSSPLFPGLDLILQANFPDAPAQASLYRWVDPADWTPEEVNEISAGFMPHGQVYREKTSDSVSGNFLAIENTAHLYFSSWPRSLNYYAHTPAIFLNAQCAPPCLNAEIVAEIEARLQALKLLNFPYQLRQSEHRPWVIQFFQTLDGAPVLTDAEGGAQLEVQAEDNGSLTWLTARSASFEAQGSYPLTPARQAWQSLLAGDGTVGVVFREFRENPEPARWLYRQYVPGANQGFFGYAHAYESMDGDDPLILLNQYPVTGNIQGLAQAAAGGRLIQAWGQVSGVKPDFQLALDSWQVSVFPDQAVEGVIEQNGMSIDLVTPEGGFVLPAMTESNFINTSVTVRGVVLEETQPILEWYAIQSGPKERVRAGGPGLHPLKLDGQQQSSAALPERLEGTTGIPQIIVHAYSDGSSQVEVQFRLNVEAGQSAAPVARLDGAGIQGIEDYHNLPVRLWGRLADTQSVPPLVNVERFEPLYPELSIEAWLGLIETVNLDDQEVWLFTTPEEEQYVIESSINAAQAERLPGPPGDPLIIEGIQIPERTFGGYPVIHDLQWFSGVGRNDLEDYTLQSARPRLVQEPGAAGARRTAVIETIELVYLTPTVLLEQPSFNIEANLVQPVWRFRGRFKDGAYFEILVQALSPEYLSSH